MRKAAIRNGDPTTTGGFVIAHSSTIHDNNEKIALSGDEATCGNCKGAHKIFGTGKGMSEGTRDVVIDGDRVLCPCGRNRVMVGINPGVWIDVYQSDSRPDSLSASSPFDQRDAGSSKREQHACWFYVLDSITGEPLRNQSFIADVAGIKQSGKTDGDGYAKVETQSAQSIDVHVIFSSPKRELNPAQGA